MNLKAIAASAMAVGMKAAGNTKVAATIYAGPTNTHNTTTDSTAQTWAYTETVQALPFDDKDEAPQDPEYKTRRFLVDAASFSSPAAVQAIDAQSLVSAEGHTWNVWRLDIDPARAGVIIHTRRKG